MPQERNSLPPWKRQADIAEDIVARAQQDIVFTMKFIGESQYQMTQHFRKFVASELSRCGVDHDDHPLLQVFIDTHAAELREFVFEGVSLTRQFRVDRIEEMLGDTTGLFRTDIWDALSNHIKMAEEHFQKQVPDIPALLKEMEIHPISGGQK